MSKNIVIQQTGQPQNITAAKINTPELDGGSCAWVPEDETVLDEITITENGDYTPDHYGFSKVTVNVENPPQPTLGEINITENGSYKASDYGYDAFSKVKIDVHGDSPYKRIYFYAEPVMPFCEGMAVDLTGVIIHAVKADDTEIDITSECMFVPQEGSIIPMGMTEFPLTVFWTAGGQS